jgi:hypothetical protein
LPAARGLCGVAKYSAILGVAKYSVCVELPRVKDLLFPMGVWMCSWNGVLVVLGALFKELPDHLVICR